MAIITINKRYDLFAIPNTTHSRKLNHFDYNLISEPIQQNICIQFTSEFTAVSRFWSHRKIKKDKISTSLENS
jgi:hypothetical protein